MVEVKASILKSVLTMVSALVLFNGCSNIDWESFLAADANVADTTAPTVVSTSPADDATATVLINASISVTFSESMNVSSITTNTSDNSCSGTVQLITVASGSCVQMSGAPAASNDNKTFTITPSSNLNQTSYKLRVTTGAQDASGNALSTTYTMTDGFNAGS